MAQGVYGKNNDTLVQAFKELFQKTGPFVKLQTGRGKDFTNKKLQTFLKQQNIEHFHSHNFDIKLSIIERFTRTLKKIVAILYTHQLQKLFGRSAATPRVLQSHFSYLHQSTPAFVNADNQEVFQNLHAGSKYQPQNLNSVILCVCP